MDLQSLTVNFTLRQFNAIQKYLMVILQCLHTITLDLKKLEFKKKSTLTRQMLQT